MYLENRLQILRVADGLTWIADYNATTVNAVWFALEMLPAPIYLISKHGGPEIDHLLKEKVRIVFDLSQSLNWFDKAPLIVKSLNPRAAARNCFRMRKEGVTVLFSPGAYVTPEEILQFQQGAFYY